ncbi:unnamed protein product [Urochloa humidicola]
MRVVEWSTSYPSTYPRILFGWVRERSAKIDGTPIKKKKTTGPDISSPSFTSPWRLVLVRGDPAPTCASEGSPVTPPLAFLPRRLLLLPASSLLFGCRISACFTQGECYQHDDSNPARESYGPLCAKQLFCSATDVTERF